MRAFDGSAADTGCAGLQAALDGVDVVGRWHVDVRKDLVTADALVALLFGFTPDAAEGGLSLTAFGGGVHPDDRGHVLSHIGRCAREGGWFIAEHRVCSADGRTRRILARGRFARDKTGAVASGEGIVVDITQVHPDDGPRVFMGATEAESPLERAADAILAGHDALASAGASRALALTEALLIEIGIGLAQAQERARPGGLH